MDINRIENWTARLKGAAADEIKAIHKQITPIEIANKTANIIACPLFMKSDVSQTIIKQAEYFVEAATIIEASRDFKPGFVLYDRLYKSLSADGKNLIDKWLSSRGPVDFDTTKKRFRRLDGFLVDYGIQIIEMNQSAPLAISFYERAQEFNKRLAQMIGSEDYNSPSLYAALADWFISLGGSKKMTVAVSMEKGYPAKFIDLPIAVQGIAAEAMKRGYEINFILAEPTQFTYQDGVMKVSNQNFDLLWRNTVYLKNYNVDLSQYQAIRYSKKMPQVNDLLSWLFRSKEFFAMIWDDELISVFNDLSIDVKKLRSICPRTYSLSKIKGLDLNKDRYILKRADDGFGKGIRFGHELEIDEWQDFLDGKNGYDWIAQELATVQKIDLPIVTPDGNLQIQSMVLDCNPYHSNGCAGPILARAMPYAEKSEKMNIVAGAAIGAFGW